MDLGSIFNRGLPACKGAEIHIRKDGDFEVRIVELSLQKKLIQIEGKKEYGVNANLLKKLSIQGPLAVTLTGKGILIKKTERLESLTEQSLRNLLPNFKLEEFYLQHFQSGEYSYITFVRRDIADPVISALKLADAELLLFSLGPFVVDHTIPQLNNYGPELNFDGHRVILSSEKNWLDYAYSAEKETGFELKIDIEPIPEQFLLSYASAFQLLLNDRLEVIAVDSTEIRNALVEYTAKLKFRTGSMIILLSLFVLLFVNFLLFSYYNSSNQALAGKAGHRSDIYADRQKQEVELKEKELMVNKLGWNHGVSYAYLCDQIGQTVPKAITLNELSINTFHDGPVGINKPVVRDPGNLKIIGQSASIYTINDWIYTLKQKSWVKQIELQKYVTDEQNGTQVFTLLLNY